MTRISQTMTNFINIFHNRNPAQLNYISLQCQSIHLFSAPSYPALTVVGGWNPPQLSQRRYTPTFSTTDHLESPDLRVSRPREEAAVPLYRHRFLNPFLSFLLKLPAVKCLLLRRITELNTLTKVTKCLCAAWLSVCPVCTFLVHLPPTLHVKMRMYLIHLNMLLDFCSR